MNRLVSINRGLAVLVAGSALCGVALAQVSGGGPGFVSGGAYGMTVLAGTNTSASGTLGAGTFSSKFTGDIITSLITPAGPGRYGGGMTQYSIVPFTVGALPVRFGAASVHANFKMVASGGNAIPGGNDPVVTVTLLTRLYQQLGAVASPIGDPWLSAIEFTQTWTQNGNGLQVIDTTLGPATSNYIVTPGNFYLYQALVITTSITSNGGIQPPRGVGLATSFLVSGEIAWNVNVVSPDGAGRGMLNPGELSMRMISLPREGCPCDLNADDYVDDADFVTFAEAYNALVVPDAFGPADFNFDDLVDDSDFVVFAGAYDQLICNL